MTPYISLLLHISPYISLYLPISPYTSPSSRSLSPPGGGRPLLPVAALHLPISPYISLYLPTSPYISLHLPTSLYISRYANVLYARALSERLNQIHSKRGSKRRVLSAVAGPGFVSTPILTATGMSGLSAAGMSLLAATAMRAPRNGVAGIVRAVMDDENAVAGALGLGIGTQG